MKKTYNTETALPPEAPVDDITSGPNVDSEVEGEDQQDPNESGGMLAKGGEVPELSKQDQAYLAGLMKLLHSKETAPMIEKMLQAGDPIDTIPKTALAVNAQMEQMVGTTPSLETLLLACVYLVQDLIQIGNVGGFFQVEGDQLMQDILKTTMETYIKDGLKKGTIDPVELQQKAGALMDKDQQAQGLDFAKKSGIPEEANHITAMETYGKQREQQGMLKASPAGGAA